MVAQYFYNILTAKSKGKWRWFLLESSLKGEILVIINLPSKVVHLLCVSSYVGCYIEIWIEASQRLLYTPLVNNTQYKNQYFIGVTIIQIGRKSLAIDYARLKFYSEGNGGTIHHGCHTDLHCDPWFFHKAAKARNIMRVASLNPFGACFDAKIVLSTRIGPSVPTIGLVL